MFKGISACLLAFALGAGLMLALPASTTERITSVFVTNIPSPQEIRGQVQVKGIIRHSALERKEDLIVSPAERYETTQLTDGGVLRTDGFTSVSLSFQGEIKGQPSKSGAVGVILLPDESSILRAYQEDGHLQLPLEAAVTVAANQGSYFSASEADLPIAFPRYRILLYNSTDKTASVNVFAYLKN
ncbi:MAG: hypothetical protein K0U98_17840 [Deltaproteobacteria bacterium]|nr:hypothetical protein [Deltaproteobacteria bacterium]